MIKRVSKDWIPFWGDKWLFGSMRLEFDAAERGIWWDLMALAMKDDGYIRANENIPYLTQQLAGMLLVPEELLTKTIDKFVETGKYIRLENGTFKVTNWEKYCFTDRHMRRFEEDEMSAKPDSMTGFEDRQGGVADTRKEKNRIEKNRKEKKICFNFQTERFENITEEIKKKWGEAYPAVNIENFIKRMEVWQAANPIKRKSNYERAFANWLRSEQDKGGTRQDFKPSQIGKSTKPRTQEQKKFAESHARKREELLEKYQVDIDIARENRDKKAYETIQEKIKLELAEWSAQREES
jgi:hypothetical protein